MALVLLACSPTPDPAMSATVPAGPASNLGSSVNMPGFDGGPSPAEDGLTLYFASDRIGGQGGSDLWVVSRQTRTAPFGEPRNLGPVNSAANESAPEIADNGRTLYFDSDRPGGLGSYDLWVARRVTVDEPFGTPENLGAALNSTASDGHPSVSHDGRNLYFQSRRAGGLGDADIWMASRATVTEFFTRVENLGPPVNSPYFDGEPSSWAEGILIFSSERPGGLGGRDLWMAIRQRSGRYTATRNLGSAVNSTMQDLTPDVSHDGRTVYFMSDRPGGSGGLDLWMAPLFERALR